MRKIYSLVLSMIMTLSLLTVMNVNVNADEATLSALKVQAKDSAGNLTDVTITPEFTPDVTEYNATVTSDITRLVLTPTTTEDDASFETDWEALDEGDNTSFVYVTAADGTETKYTIYTKKLTEDEEATYQPEEEVASDVTVKVDGVKMKITSGFQESDIPEGFKKTTYKYKKNDVPAIEGEKKELVAMWLEPEEETSESDKAKEGFYIYDKESKDFYAMHNIYIKSRMYTVINEANPDKFLNDYETGTVTIIDQDVKAWILDETNSLYLLYAMNWEGDSGLYCYDDIEKCFQRYIIDDAAATQLEAANEAINNLQKKNNELVKKYNKSNSMKWKIIAVLLIIIVILVFVVLNLILKNKTKKLTGDEDIEQKSKKRKNKAGKEENEELNDDEEEEYDSDEEELFQLIEDIEDEEDFVILDDESIYTNVDIEEDNGFDINSDEIDISDQIIKEVEEQSKPDTNKDTFTQELNDILSKEEPEEDDDGFTFI